MYLIFVEHNLNCLKLEAFLGWKPFRGNSALLMSGMQRALWPAGLRGQTVGSCSWSTVRAILFASCYEAKQRVACRWLYALFHSRNQPPGNTVFSGGYLDTCFGVHMPQLWTYLLNFSTLTGVHFWKSKGDVILNKMEYHHVCWYLCYLCCQVPLLQKVDLWDPIISC